ncbi:hypothetical protein Tco_1214672 [Tanacetum coccineum]
MIVGVSFMEKGGDSIKEKGSVERRTIIKVPLGPPPEILMAPSNIKTWSGGGRGEGTEGLEKGGGKRKVGRPQTRGSESDPIMEECFAGKEGKETEGHFVSSR